MTKEQFEEIIENIREQHQKDLDSLLDYITRKFEPLISGNEELNK